jgi:hypothetical protein
MIKKKEL